MGFEAEVDSEGVILTPQKNASGLAGKVMRYSGGLITTKEHANAVLLTFALACLAFAYWIGITYAFPPAPPAPRFREDIPLEVREKLPPGVWETIPSRYDEGENNIND